MRRRGDMKKSDQKRIMEEFLILKKQRNEIKLTKDNIDAMINNIGTETQEYSQIRVMLEDLQKHRFKLEKGDYIAICDIKNNGENIYVDMDVGNIFQTLAPVYKHSSMYFKYPEFKQIWNSSVEL